MERLQVRHKAGCMHMHNAWLQYKGVLSSPGSPGADGPVKTSQAVRMLVLHN